MPDAGILLMIAVLKILQYEYFITLQETDDLRGNKITKIDKCVSETIRNAECNHR